MMFANSADDLAGLLGIPCVHAVYLDGSALGDADHVLHVLRAHARATCGQLSTLAVDCGSCNTGYFLEELEELVEDGGDPLFLGALLLHGDFKPVELAGRWGDPLTSLMLGGCSVHLLPCSWSTRVREAVREMVQELPAWMAGRLQCGVRKEVHGGGHVSA